MVLSCNTKKLNSRIIELSEEQEKVIKEASENAGFISMPKRKKAGIKNVDPRRKEHNENTRALTEVDRGVDDIKQLDSSSIRQEKDKNLNVSSLFRAKMESRK